MEATMMTPATNSFTAKAFESLQKTRDEISKRYPDKASYVREQLDIMNVMQVEFPKDNEGEKIYQEMMVAAASLRFA
ncbi:hypothetical protein WBJ53_05285 [Spirosoma sp. SC4-14]|uniref:hypothetical protein n=1 Tax=Spirosoma sp. SC4-14 TaxID=3128900 RepID=UPI0030CA84F6